MRIDTRWFAALLVAFAWCATGLVMAETPERGCADAETTAEMRECINLHYVEVDQELNDVYTHLMSQLDSERRQLLRDAQRAWIDYRDKNAVFAASVFEGGTLYPVIEVSERAAMTERRVEELTAHLQ